ncbi:MAG: hypothetical protein HKP57_02950, partial [Halobacteria archaeon]|nr:hypothetical protein [Halobacteria archaeon]
MQQRKAHRVAQTPSITKPGALSLLSHILKGAVSDDMMLPAFFGIGLAIALYLGNFPYHEVISALLATTLLL